MTRTDSRYTRLSPEIIYGPVKSRRLGSSIGINLFPSLDKKVCTFNCVYCFFKVNSVLKPQEYVTVNQVVKALVSYAADPNTFEYFRDSPYITFSGNGEPTLHNQFPIIVNEIIKWRDQNRKEKQLAIFTNGTGLFDETIYRALLQFDTVFLKLDVGSNNDFIKVCRPLAFKDYNLLRDKIKQFFLDVKNNNGDHCKVILQTAIYNPSDSSKQIDINAWIDAVKDINPNTIHLYELEYSGIDYKISEYFDYLSFADTVINKLRPSTIVPKYYINNRQYYMTVYLCYAVDSILYLPLYIGLIENIFKKHSISLHHFESTDGDQGAYDALKNGSAQFALCDPSVVIDDVEYLENKKNSKSISIVSIIIDKIGLWLLSGEEIDQLEDIRKIKTVTTYVKNTTANILMKWFRKKVFLHNETSLQINAVQPGEEFKSAIKFIEEADFSDNIVLSADPLGAIICKPLKGKERRLHSISKLKRINPYMFTGLLVDNNFYKIYPEAVKAVKNGFKEAVGYIYNDRYFNDNKIMIYEHLKNIFNMKIPNYLRAAKNTISLDTAIPLAVEMIRDEKLYSKTGKINYKSFYNAFRVRSGLNDSRYSLRKIFFFILRYFPKKGNIKTIIKILLFWPIKDVPIKRLIINILFVSILFILSLLLLEAKTEYQTITQALLGLLVLITSGYLINKITEYISQIKKEKRQVSL